MTFPAIAYSEDFDDGRESGALRIDGDYLIFEGQDVLWRIHHDDLILDGGGTAGRQIFIKSKKDLYRISATNTDMLKHPFFNRNEHLSQKSSTIVHGRNLIRLAILGSFGIFFGGLALLFIYRGTIVHSIAQKMPYSFEQTLGKQYIDQLSREGTIDSTSAAAKTLREKMSILTKTVDSSYQFNVYISDDDQINAFALPGGFMVFNKGLLDAAKSWEEVLGVGGHEMAHVTEKHHTRGILSQVGVFTILSMMFGDGSSITNLIFGAGAKLEGLSYSRSFETESDVKGFEYLIKSRVNPRGLRTFFKKLEAEHGEIGNSKSLEFVSTHPSPENRMQKLESLEKGVKLKNMITFDDYKLFKVLMHPECTVDEL